MTVKFDWDTHVGSQTPQQFHLDSGDADIEAAVARYIADVRSGEVFGEPVPLDQDAESDMVSQIRAAL